MIVDKKKLEAGEYCAKGSATCFCAVGFPVEYQCPNCAAEDGRDSYCICVGKPIKHPIWSVVTNRNKQTILFDNKMIGGIQKMTIEMDSYTRIPKMTLEISAPFLDIMAEVEDQNVILHKINQEKK